MHAPGDAARHGARPSSRRSPGPNDDGTGWAGDAPGLHVRAAGDSIWSCSPRTTSSRPGFAEGPDGERVPLDAVPPAAERRPPASSCASSPPSPTAIDAPRRSRRTIEQELRDLVGGADRISIEAERHWAEPYHYELDVAVEPHGDPVEALQILAEAGGDGWLACRDDGWRCDLWWSSTRDPDAMLLVPEVHAAPRSRSSRGRPGPPPGGGAPARRRRRAGRDARRAGAERERATPQTRRRAMKNPDVPCRCGVVSRNSGRFGCANCGHSSPSGSGSRPSASTTASFSSAFSVQTE